MINDWMKSFVLLCKSGFGLLGIIFVSNNYELLNTQMIEVPLGMFCMISGIMLLR